MPSFDIVSRIDLQEVDNAVNITKKTILSRYDFRGSKTEITLSKKDKKIRVTTEDDMKMRAVQDTLIENLVKRKVDRKCLDPKESQSHLRAWSSARSLSRRGRFGNGAEHCQDDQRQKAQSSSGDPGESGPGDWQKH